MDTKKTRAKWIAIILILMVGILFSAALAIIYINQDELVQSQVASLNHDHKGLIEVGNTHLDPFQNFPYISIKVDSVKVLEAKADNSPLILEVADIYIGFDLLDIISGNFDIQTMVIENGFFNLVFHEDGTTNIQNALASPDDVEKSEPVNIHLKKIELVNVDLHKLNESTDTDVETFVYWAYGGFKLDDGSIDAHIDTEFELNLIQSGDTTYINHKHFEFHTDVSLNEETGILTIEPSGITIEHADFDIQGTIETINDMNLDIAIKGTKSNFDLFYAFAPHEVIPVLERYENAGEIYLNAVVKGPSANGNVPFINAEFGASQAYLENVLKGRKVDDMGFKGHFTNGKDRHNRTSGFSLQNMTASLEKGNVVASIEVKNFDEPDVDMQMKADFDLDFLAEFFELDMVENPSGKLSVDMKFHDIIDIEHPELALTDLNQAYYMELIIDNLQLESSMLPVPLDKLDAHLTMNGKRAELDKFDVKLGKSDLSIHGFLSDLPAIVHHTDIPVYAHLDIESEMIDVAELTRYSENDTIGIDEQIENFSVGFSFESTARSFTESEFLPVGEFFIDSFHARLKHYPHELHDFHADVLIDSIDLKIKDLTGYIDASDFHIDGLVHDFGFWFQPEKNGDVDLDLSFESKALHLEDVFSYKGENYVPSDYQHEEFDDLKIHANTSMHYRDSELKSIDINLDKLTAKMKVHPLRFENFNGRIHYEDEHLVVEKFQGKIGKTEFDLDANYYMGKDESIKKRDNHIGLNAAYIDLDELANYNPPPAKTDTSADSQEDVAQHAETFNIYKLPFTDMTVDVDVGHFMYHGLDLQQIHARLRTTQDHFLHIDTIGMKVAGGTVKMSGYFNGSDPDHIYLKPKLTVNNADIDKLMFKFESLGHDVEISENLHGSLSATVNGNIRVYPDMVPDLDQSEIHLDVEILKGRLVNYEPMELLSDYMGSKDLTNIRFDTLTNHIDMTNGLLSIPSMDIETTLGHFEIAGTHDLEHNLEYFIRIPWKTIKEGARNKLFGAKKVEEVDDQIVEKDPNERIRYLNLKIHGTLDDFKVGLSKKRKRKS